ncbi:MAG: PDZ domain-containing protein [Candidatus Eisenbacteria bacterium]|nr:PDZ domain-containing protein [Candidatus Eisenbacteria bacterium]
MVLHSRALTVLVLVAVVALVIAAGSSVMARPVTRCSFATPCVAKSVEKVDSTPKGWLGVEIQDLTPELREVLELDEETEGVLVAGVSEGGPAEKAGIGKGDVIMSLDAKVVDGTPKLVAMVSKRKPGETVTVVLLRDGRKKTVKVTLGSEHLESLPSVEHLKFELNRGRLGVNVVDLNPDLGGYFGAAKGVLVTEVLEGTAAEDAGIKAGDIIISADGKRVESREGLLRILGKREVGDKVELVVLRKGRETKLGATLEEGSFMAWVRGVRKKGSSIPERYITPRVEKFKGNVELRRRLDDLSRQMEELRKKLDELNEDLKTQRD